MLGNKYHIDGLIFFKGKIHPKMNINLLTIMSFQNHKILLNLQKKKNKKKKLNLYFND